jgi:hypothetical protein
MTKAQLRELITFLQKIKGDDSVEQLTYDKFKRGKRDVVVKWTTPGLAAMEMTITPNGSTITKRIG